MTLMSRRHRLTASFLLVLAGTRGGAAEECRGVLNGIRSEIRQAYGMQLTCAQLERAAKALPVETLSESEGTWAYEGDRAIREDFWQKWRIRLSSGMLILGTLEHAPPEAQGKPYLLIFGLTIARPAWGLLAAAKSEQRVATERAAAVLGEGASYDSVGIFFKDDAGRIEGPGLWLRLEDGAPFEGDNPAPIGEARSCVPCRGWLCPPEPVACFADFNANQVEELLLASACRRHACGVRMLEPTGRGGWRFLLDEAAVAGRWHRRPEGWVLVASPVCPWGEFCGQGEDSLGNPNCGLPDVYRFEPRTGAPKIDRRLRDEYWPVEERKVPAECEARDRRGALVLSKDGRFVRFRP